MPNKVMTKMGARNKAKQLLMHSIVQTIEEWLTKETEFYGNSYTPEEIELIQEQMNRTGESLLNKIGYTRQYEKSFRK